MKKATPGEKANIDEILSHLRMETDFELQVAVYEGPPAGAAEAADPASTSKGPSEEETSGIFKRILQKQISSPSRISESAEEVVRRGLKRQNAFMQPALQRQRAFCVAPEESTASEPATPVKPKKVKKPDMLPGSSQSQGSRFAVLGLDEEDEELMTESMAQKFSTEAVAKKSKPTSKAKAAAGKSAAKAKPKAAAKAKVLPKPRQGVFRRRVKDTSYHKAKLLALKQGLSPEAAAKKGREAAKQTAADVDAGVLKEEG